jgi:hypothetical protein
MNITHSHLLTHCARGCLHLETKSKIKIGIHCELKVWSDEKGITMYDGQMQEKRARSHGKEIVTQTQCRLRMKRVLTMG